MVAVTALLVLNFLDFLTTYVGLTYFEDLESNPVELALGGPLSPLAILLKLAVFPGLVLGVAWFLWRKFKSPLPALGLIVPPAIMFASCVANNVLIMTKKVEKVARKAHKVADRF